MTGEVCERTDRRWTCIELVPEYCEAALGRFIRVPGEVAKPAANPKDPSNYYRVPRPGILWNGSHNDSLPKDGGKKRRSKPQNRARLAGVIGQSPPMPLTEGRTLWAPKAAGLLKHFQFYATWGLRRLLRCEVQLLRDRQESATANFG